MFHIARIFRLTLLCWVTLSIQIGCATVTAVKIPGPVADETIALGTHRKDVEVVLKSTPVNEYHDGDGTTARYQYKNGPHQASKGRVILYIAGDVFTLFLSELIFWPIEAYASGRTDRIGTAHYDASNLLENWTIDRPGGERLFSEGEPSTSPESGPLSPPESPPADATPSKTSH